MQGIELSRVTSLMVTFTRRVDVRHARRLHPDEACRYGPQDRSIMAS